MLNRPDIVLIVLDTFRADRLSCYGYPRNTTPTLDAFAGDSVLFERAISPAQWTIPAHASIFSGVYPSVHGTTQTHLKHARQFRTLAELLRADGYQTVGFCNNLLLSSVNNELDRGFEQFYAYAGTFPSRPSVASTRYRFVGRVAQRTSRIFRYLVRAVQTQWAKNDTLLRLSLHAKTVQLWHRRLNLKGDTEQSLRDMVGFLRTRAIYGKERPLFVFLNLMETHMPYWPPARWMKRFASYMTSDHEAQAFLRRFNAEQYTRMIPILHPFTEDENRVIQDMHDTEVAYEDEALGLLLRFLDHPEVRDNTLVIITSDHGDGVNHHGILGHLFSAYDDLLHVPLMMRYPAKLPAGTRISQPVSTRNIYHTILDIAGLDHRPPSDYSPEETRQHSLERALHDHDEGNLPVFSECYSPDMVVRLMEKLNPDAIDKHHCRALMRVVYLGDYKLITHDGVPYELFNVKQDPAELINILDKDPGTTMRLKKHLDDFMTTIEQYSASRNGLAPIPLKDTDPEIIERLRRLGYME